jgi:hypothetical protein
MDYLDDVRWNADGLVAAIAQDATSLKVLTLAWMNRDALARTNDTREAHYFSRSRDKLWRKGESPATCSACARSGSTATATRSCCWSTRKAALRAIRVTNDASSERSPTVRGMMSSPF